MLPTANIVILLAYTLATFAGLRLFWRYKRVNPVFWFIGFQWLMATGTFALADFTQRADRFYAFLFFVALGSYVATAWYFWTVFGMGRVCRQFWNKPIKLDTPPAHWGAWAVLIVSVLVTTAYYRAVGGNILLNLLSGTKIDDYSSARLATYSGDTYFAPGYVNQFKNVLLPLTVSIVAGWAWLRRSRLALYTVVVLGGGGATLALLGTGQRAYLMFAYAALLFGVSSVKSLKLRSIAIPSLGVFVLFAFLTSFYQARNLENADNPITALVLKSFERFFVVEQTGALGAFRYLYTQESVYFSEWADQIRGVIPGMHGSTLQHDLFALVHGTDRGTEAYAILAGFYYNGGVVAVPACFGLLAVAHGLLYRRFLLGKRTIYRSFTYAALFLYLSIFVSGGLDTLINNGVLTFILFLLVKKAMQLVASPRTSSPAPHGMAPHSS